jgi:hypothetical protein
LAEPQRDAMAIDENLVERMRAALDAAGKLREVKMFGGLCFMLNSNMVAGTSKHGILLRVGKDAPRQRSSVPMHGQWKCQDGQWKVMCS